MPVEGAVPDFVIALAGSVVSTLVALKNGLKTRRVAGHLRCVRELNSFLSRVEI